MKVGNKFNLVDEVWIPVCLNSGEQRLVSLEQIFSNSDVFDLCSPAHERVSLYYFLIAISAAADPDKKDKSVLAYLKKHHNRFNLFDDKRPFLQTDSQVKFATEISTSKLDFRLAAGSSCVHLDNHGVVARAFSYDRLARMLLTCQGFAIRGTIGSAQCGEFVTLKSGAKDGPFHKYAHTFVLGQNLLETIKLNQFSRKDVGLPFGKPVWELDNPLPTSLSDSNENEITQSYLGRLVPLSRLIRLHSDGIKMNFAEGFRYEFDKAFLYTAKIKSAKGEFYPLACELNESVWRSVPAILGFLGDGQVARCVDNARAKIGLDNPGGEELEMLKYKAYLKAK
jgi:CRISPR system Cascade subunit CasA